MYIKDSQGNLKELQVNIPEATKNQLVQESIKYNTYSDVETQIGFYKGEPLYRCCKDFVLTNIGNSQWAFTITDFKELINYGGWCTVESQTYDNYGCRSFPYLACGTTNSTILENIGPDGKGYISTHWPNCSYHLWFEYTKK